MLIFMIVCIVCAAGESILLFVSRRRTKARMKKTRKSLCKLMEERVLLRTLQSNITSDEAASAEYQSLFVRIEFPDTSPWLANVFALDECITIGRSRENKITIRDDGVSRLHCKIALINSALYLQDLGSANGTRIRRNCFREIILAGQEFCRLQDKDRIIIGNYRMRMRILYGYQAVK